LSPECSNLICESSSQLDNKRYRAIAGCVVELGAMAAIMLGFGACHK